MVNVSASQIIKFRSEVDLAKNGGNENGYVDGSEIVLFEKKCKSIGYKNVNKVLDEYNTNRYEKEANFDLKNTTSKNSVEAAVIASFNEDSKVNANDCKKQFVETIVARLKKIDNSWFQSADAVDNVLFNINDKNYQKNQKDIILGVVSNDEAVDALDDEASDETKNNVIALLLGAARERQIDVSNIVFEEDGQFVVGRDVPGGNFGESVTASRSIGEFFSGDDTNFQAVVKALRDAIERGKKVLNGTEGTKEDMFLQMALVIDSHGNQNGVIDSEDEIVSFKQFAANKGIDVDTILEQIRDNESNGVENKTKAQKTIAFIFDPNQNESEKQIDGKNADIKTLLNKGLESWDSDIVNKAASKINGSNVIEVLNKDPNMLKQLAKVGRWSLFSTNYNQTFNKIIDSLVERANSEHIQVSDIVVKSGDDYITADGDEVANDGFWTENRLAKAEIIEKLYSRINNELNKRSR